MITRVAALPAALTFTSMVAFVACVGVPFREPLVQAAFPHVSAPDKIESAEPPVMIGRTVGAVAPLGVAMHSTEVIVRVAPNLLRKL
jgi:hypothetical protein